MYYITCSLGTDRSSIFVTMCILVQQLRTEKSIDICSTARKIRSQRPRLLNSFVSVKMNNCEAVNAVIIYVNFLVELFTGTIRVPTPRHSQLR